jgi:hypothetical protein
MLETALNQGQLASKLEVGIGVSSHPEPDIAIGEAAESAAADSALPSPTSPW